MCFMSEDRAVPRAARAAKSKKLKRQRGALWVTDNIWKIVASAVCPTCGAEKHEPCVNQLYGVHEPPGGFKRKQRRLYQSYVHRSRRRAAT